MHTCCTFFFHNSRSRISILYRSELQMIDWLHRFTPISLADIGDMCTYIVEPKWQAATAIAKNYCEESRAEQSRAWHTRVNCQSQRPDSFGYTSGWVAFISFRYSCNCSFCSGVNDGTLSSLVFAILEPNSLAPLKCSVAWWCLLSMWSTIKPREKLKYTTYDKIEEDHIM